MALQEALEDLSKRRSAYPDQVYVAVSTLREAADELGPGDLKDAVVEYLRDTSSSTDHVVMVRASLLAKVAADLAD